MINNFLPAGQLEYEAYNRVYSHPNGHHIYLGDGTAASDIKWIKQKQIELVVTAAANMDNISYEKHIKHLVYNLLDCKSQNLIKYFANFFQLVQQEIIKTNILVHCRAGISRSATLVISYLMKKNNLTFKDAIAEVRKYRPKVLPNLGFQRQLKQYEKILKTQEMTTTRKFISKTSQARKHHFKKPSQIALPEICALGKTLARTKNLNMIITPKIQPSSQMESRKVRIGYFDQQKKTGVDEPSLNKYDSCSFQLPTKTLRKQSISISRKKNKNIYDSQQKQPQPLIKRLPHKLAIRDIRFRNDKVSRSQHEKMVYFN